MVFSILQGEAVYHAFYYSDWINMKTSTRKFVLLLMLLNKKSPKIDVAPFYTLNRARFTAVLKQTYTLYAIISNLYM